MDKKGMIVILKKNRLAIFFAILILIALPKPIYASTGGVINTTAKIGNSTAQLVYIDNGLTGEVALANNSVVSDQNTKDIIASKGKKVVVAVNGGYFNAYYKPGNISYPDNCPRVYATIVKDSRIINNGSDQQVATLGFSPTGQAYIDRVALSPTIIINGKKIKPWGVNRWSESPAFITHFTDEMTLPVTCSEDAKLVIVKSGRVAEIRDGGTFTVPTNSDVLVYSRSMYEYRASIEDFPSIGDGVQFVIESTPTKHGKEIWDNIHHAVSVGPTILLNGQNVVGQDLVTDPKQSADAVNQKSFAAIMNDGRLLLGTCVASYNQTANYLQSIGAVDAMSLDGGASSMLYKDGKFLQPAGRKLSNIIVLLEKPVMPETSTTISSKVLVNSKEIAFDAYNIGGYTYFKLRDLAHVLNGTEKQFEVGWDGQRISLELGMPYTPTGGEMKAAPRGKAVKNTATIYIDGKQVNLMAYLISGFNYFKLRDIAERINFGVGWNEDNKTVTINTAESYKAY